MVNLAASNFLPCFLMFLVYITLRILTEKFTNEIHSAKKNQLQNPLDFETEIRMADASDYP